MVGGQWAAAHGDAWKKFLAEKLKKCECVYPRVSRSNRRKALKEDEGGGIQPGIPAECLLCFAPAAVEVRPCPSPSPTPAPRAGRSTAAAARSLARCLPPPLLERAIERTGPSSERFMQPRPHGLEPIPIFPAGWSPPPYIPGPIPEVPGPSLPGRALSAACPLPPRCCRHAAGTTPLTPPPRRQHAAARCPQTRSPGGEMRHRVASSGARGGKENASTAHEQSYSNRCSSLRKNIFLLLLL